MARPFIVVPIADADIARSAIGMLYAAHKNLSYPMPDNALYVWDPRPNVAQTECAFGPIDELDGNPDDAGWALGQSVQTSLGSLTLPGEARFLDLDTWFWYPPE